MRVSKEKAAENRERILKGAARLFRERGLSAVGVDALTDAAGLTYGSLYSHFGSKDALMAEAVGYAFEGFSKRMSPETDLLTYVASYLSPGHRDDPGSGCSVATLGCEMARQSAPVRHKFTQGFKGTIGRVIARLPKDRKHGSEPEHDALAILSMLVGAMVLARAVDDTGLSDRILSVAKARIEEVI